MIRRRAKVDANQGEIVKALREIPGVTVRSLAALGEGTPDLLVGYAGKNLLLEVKKPGGKLTDDQAEFFVNWAGQVVKVESLGEALIAIGLQE